MRLTKGLWPGAAPGAATRRFVACAIVLGGWASGSTYPLLGGPRSTVQMISYELAMSLSFVAVFLYAGSMSTSQIVSAQSDLWYAIALLPSIQRLSHST